jgi:hypothetical protein
MRRYPLGLLVAAAVVFLHAEPAGAQLAPPPPNPNMRSGGLAPPPPGSGPLPPPPGTPNETEKRLEESDARDSGRGLEFFYFAPEGGFAYTGLTALHANGDLVAPSSSASGAGATWGVGAGARLLFITVGPHFQMAGLKDMTLWTLGLDLGWHIPLGRLEPYAKLGGGYARLGHSADTLLGAGNDVRVQGFDLRLAAGLDYYVTSVFSAGAKLSGELLGLSRSALAASVPTTGEANIYKQDASGLGLAFAGTIVLALHF